MPTRRSDKPVDGPVLAATKLHVTALQQEYQLDTEGVTLCALAENLAGLLDKGEPVTMTGTWARELRATLAAIVKEPDDGDDDEAGWLDDLPTAVRDTPEPRKGNARRASR